MKMKRQEYFGIAAFLNLLLLFAFSVCGSSFAAPAADFPKKKITIIVNFGPGGARDILARGLGNTMSKHLGVPVVVMNQPGAGGEYKGIIEKHVKKVNSKFGAQVKHPTWICTNTPNTNAPNKKLGYIESIQ